MVVNEGSDAVLPCLISTKDIIPELFDWKKDGQKEVFLYDAGIHYKVKMSSSKAESHIFKIS